MTKEDVIVESGVAKKKHRRFTFSRKQLCIPYGLFLVMFVVIPLFVIVYYAFTDKTGAFTFRNFVDFFSDASKISTLLISVLVSLAVTAICLLIAYPVAYILAKMPKKVAFVLLLLFIMPMWINFVLRAMAMKEFLGLINVPLGSGANIIGLVYDYLPFMIMPLYSTLIKMDRSLEEAACDLGAGRVKVFTSVTLPMSLSGILSGITMVFLPSMTCYVISDTFSNGKVTIIGKLIELWFGQGDNWNYGSAIALIMLVIMLVTTLVTNKFSKNEDTRGTNL